MSVFGFYDRGGSDQIAAVSQAPDVGGCVVGDRARVLQLVGLLERHGLDADGVRAVDTDSTVLDVVTVLRLGQQLRRSEQLLGGMDYVGLRWQGGGVVVPVGGSVRVCAGFDVRVEEDGGAVVSVSGVEHVIGDAPGVVSLSARQEALLGVGGPLRVERVGGEVVFAELFTGLGQLAQSSVVAGKGLKLVVGDGVGWADT